MLKNYLRIAWRNILQNKVISFINISGLSIGLAAGIICLIWIKTELAYNNFHTNLRDIHLVMNNQNEGGDINTYQATPGPLADVLRSEMPEVKRAARTTTSGRQLLKYGDKTIYESGMYAEPDFFNIMSFPPIEGNAVSALQHDESIVLTETAARKLFGNEDPIGKTIRHNNLRDLKVAAVLRDVPQNSTVRFNLALPFNIYKRENSDWIDGWTHNALFTWVQLNPNVNLATLNGKLNNLLKRKNIDQGTEFFAYSLKDLGLKSEFKNGKPTAGRTRGLILLGIIGVFVLLIACINFMNLATARSAHRSREVGVRKVLGASKASLAIQFLVEATAFAFLALILGIGLVFLTLPSLSNFVQKNIEFNLGDWQIWLGAIGIGLFTGIIAGSYPAFFLSRFNVVYVLKGVFKIKGGGLRKSLVTFQFVISIFLIISTIVIFRQQKFSENRPVGYDQENLVELPSQGDLKENYEITRNELSQIPGVKSISAGSDDMVRFGSQTNGIDWPGKRPDQDFMITTTQVHYDWVKTMGTTLVAGRDFNRSYGSDSLGVLLNQAAVRRMELKEPVVGTRLGSYTVIGVIQDFVYNDPFNSPLPLAVYLNPEGNKMNHLFIRMLNEESWRRNLATVEQVVKKNNPNFPFEFRFTKDEFQEKFNGIRSTGQLLNTVGGIAIFISCLGLFGLSAFLAEKRMKEIGIRKVLGASPAGLWMTLSKDLLKPVVIAFLIASPIAGFAMYKMLSNMEYHISLSWWIFVVAGVLAVAIALITVSYQGLKAALANPIKSIRTE